MLILRDRASWRSTTASHQSVAMRLTSRQGRRSANACFAGA